MKQPLVSVVMPVFNCEKYLREAIDSILQQTLTEFELLIINDGSTDQSLAIAKSYTDSRIRLIDNERNLGVVRSLNKGIELSRGRYVARMDSDDVSLPTRLEKQFALLEREQADICGCHWLIINDSGKFIDARLMPLDNDAFSVFLTYTVPFAGGSVMMRREFLDRYTLRSGGAQYAEDYELWMQFHRHGARFGNVNEFLFYYREHGAGFSKRLSKGNLAETRSLRRRFIRENAEACKRSIATMLERYIELSVTERLYLLLAAFRLFTTVRSGMIWRVIKMSDQRSLGLAALLILKGY